MDDIEQRLQRVDDGMATRLKLSIEMNSRMVTRLQKMARSLELETSPDPRSIAEDLIDISHDKDPS